MKLHTAPQHEAILSNVGELGEFRIRNSAKAFSILSSGLYANKIRAIIRELSCNAYDSHVAAGRKDTPFELHLPTSYEPWFAIRDYGTGLNHDQVTNIYTTYFESTKTASNDFIGALGLGSKSPFSYTDNFSVTAIQNGLKGIYTAFINNEGVPSIALMTAEETDEADGVEVKFAVENRPDFNSFYSEVHTVFQFFATKPVITGRSDVELPIPEYYERDIIPGVHHSRAYHSVAVMGNIAYPIEIPGELSDKVRMMLATCSLEMHFDIGELDFQASREGLSYIPETVAALTARIEATYDAIEARVAEKLKNTQNKWERAEWLTANSNGTGSADRVILQRAHSHAKLMEFGPRERRIQAGTGIVLSVERMARHFNVALKWVRWNTSHFETYKSRAHHVNGDYVDAWGIGLGNEIEWVINDTAVGGLERVKYHWKELDSSRYQNIILIAPADRTRPMKVERFMQWIYNPQRVHKLSELSQKPRKTSQGVPVLQLHNSYSTWQAIGNSDTVKGSVTYLPMNNFSLITEYGYTTASDLLRAAEDSILRWREPVYGVRKGALPAIAGQSNWTNFEEHLKSALSATTREDIIEMARARVQRLPFAEMIARKRDRILDQDCEYLQLLDLLGEKNQEASRWVTTFGLLQRYWPDTAAEVQKELDKMVDLLYTTLNTYPLLGDLSAWTADEKIIDYINTVNKARS